MSKINNILKEFVERCSKELNLLGIIQFGSSTYSKNSDDIDLVFFSKDEIFPTKDYLGLFKLIRKFENKFRDVSFWIVEEKYKRKAKYSISIIPFQMLDINQKIDPFFLKNLAEDRNKKILYGKDPTKFRTKLSNKDIAKRLNLEINYCLRDCLRKSTKEKALYDLFKTTLRLMLINKSVPKKEELLNSFKDEFRNKIKLPENSEDILLHKLKNEDFEDILYLTENCLKYLSK